MTEKTEDLEPTRQSLLARLKNWDDQTSWLDFFAKYWRLIYSVARRAGLYEDEAQEAVQETIIAVCKAIGSFEYDPHRCRFRSWLLLLTHHQIARLLHKRLAHLDRTPFLEEREAVSTNSEAALGSELERIWDEEWEKNLVAAATEHVKRQVKVKHFQIYDLHVLQGWPVRRVAQTLNVSVALIYMTKHRVGRLMRRAVQAIEQQEL